MNRGLDVFGRMLDIHITTLQKLLECVQGLFFVVLRLNFKRRAVMERHGTPSQRFYILHCMAEQIFVGHACGKVGNSKIPLLAI